MTNICHLGLDPESRKNNLIYSIGYSYYSPFVMPFTSQKFLAAIILAMILGMLFIGLYPFNYFPANRVSVSTSGLNFTRGIALSTVDNGWSITGPITLEIALTPSRTYGYWIPSILSLCDKSGHEVMFLGQWKNSLIVRLMDWKNGIERIQEETGAKDILKPGKPGLVTLVFNKGTALIFENGKLKSNSTTFNLGDETSKNPISSFVLGNSSTGYSSWRGAISGFTAWDRSLDSRDIAHRYEEWRSGNSAQPEGEFIRYDFNKIVGRTIRNAAGKNWDLVIPEKLTPLRRPFLELPSVRFLHTRSFYKDAVINLIGFIPLGMVLTILFITNNREKNRWRTMVMPILIGGLLSLFIEANQIFLITRTSSLTDLVLNTVGSGLGVAAAVKTQRVWSHLLW